MYLNIIYVLMLHCMIKLRLDLESTHQAGRFGIRLIQIRQIEVDINSMAYCITSALDFNKGGCVKQI